MNKLIINQMCYCGHYTALNSGMNDELERMWRKA
jgi:hypothetical protein